MHMFGDYGMGMGGGGMIVMVLFWVVIIVGVIYLIKIMSGKGRQEESAAEPLKKAVRKGRDQPGIVREDQKRSARMRQ